MTDQPSGESPSRIEQGSYRAEILQGSSAEPFWYYVIQRNGSQEIIDLMKFDSRDRAIEAAQLVLQRLNQAAATGKS